MNKKLSREEYNYAKGCLKRYNYNCINIMNIRADILSIGSQNLDGMPKAPYNITDNVLNSVIKLQEDEELQKSIREYKAVVQALELVNNKDCKYIFENYYMKSKTRWEILETGISERTFERRNQDIIYAVHNELKKLAENWRKLIKKGDIISTSYKVAGRNTSKVRATIIKKAPFIKILKLIKKLVTF